MPQPYKIEVFDHALNWRSFAVIAQPTTYFDYLTLEGVKITAPRMAVQKGDIAHVTNAGGSVVYQGIVSDVQIDKAACEISLAPLLSLYDLTVAYDRVDLQTGAIEDFIAGIITDLYISNPDTLQRVPMTVTATSSTTDTALNIKSNVHEFYDIITKAFTMYGVVVSMLFKPQNKLIETTIGKANTVKTIESRLPNVLDKSFVIGDSYGQLNKIRLISKNNESEQITYYLHTNGTISTVNTDRITPVFAAVEYVESEDFDADARAREALAPQQYNNLIELTYLRTDKLVDVDSIKIGTAVTVIDDKVYESVYTGYEQTEHTTKLLLGNVRVDLTKKMILERRKA